ncbi:acyl-CoA dehydrogenase family protein [Methylobacterium tarhaniae]|uniref:acyl-CoA dehydrogenase family protein n=2 Tax=Methylobacterium tarhaniae TaxID=1187852 RepID=UPI003CFE1BF6
MMDSPTDIQTDDAGAMLRETADRLLADRLTPQARARSAEGEWPDDVWAALDEVGLPAAILPEEAGGFGVPVADALALLTVAGSHALPLPLADTMLAGLILARAGIQVPAGPLAVAQGSDVRLDNAGRATGHAWGVPWGRHVRAVVVLADGPGGPVLVALPQAALTVEPGTDIAGDPSDAVRFEAVAAESAPAPFGAAELRAAGAATRALMMAGALGAVSTMTVGYANERRQFGRAIGQFQAVQQNLAVLAGQAASAAAAAGLAAEAVAAWAGASGPGLLPAVAAAKVRAGEAAGQAAAIAHQVHGAIGFTEEHRLHLYTGRLRAWRDAFGREAEWAQVLGRHLIAAGPEGLWPAITAA